MTEPTGPPTSPNGPHNQPPSQQNRCVVIGRLLDGGSACTVVLIRDAERHSWVLYPYGVANMGVRIAGPDAKVLARHILDGPSQPPVE